MVRRLTFTLFCVSFLAGLVQNSSAQTKQIRRVLIFYELGLSSPAVTVLDQQIRSALENSPYQIELYREYLETTLFPDPATQQEFREWDIHKYRDRKPDLIIALGRSPLKFMVDVHTKAFTDVPIVFGGTDEALAGYPKLDSDFTGVWERFDADETLEAALRLQPGTQQLFVVGGTSDFDRHLEALVSEKLRPYEDRLKISYLTDLDMPNLLQRLQHLPEHSLILYTHIGEDKAGTRFVGASQVDPILARIANAPVFSASDVDLGHGEVGGDLVDFNDEGQVIGSFAVRILNGEKPRDIPIVQGTNRYEFDWRALRRWGFNERNVPPGSLVLNRQPSAWDLYKWYIVGAVSLIALEAALIFGLLWQRRRRRSAENKLSVTHDRLRMAIEGGNFVGWDTDLKTGQNCWFGDLETMFGIPSAEYSTEIGDFTRRVHPDDRELVCRAIDSARETKTPYTAEFRIPFDDDGSVRRVIARGKFYYGSDGVPERMVGLAVDHTERYHAQQLVRESEERFRLVANTAPVMIWVAGDDMGCTYFNQQWLDFTGRSLAQELGNGWTVSVHPDDLKKCIDTYTESFNRREQFKMEYRLRRHDGEYRWIVDIGVPRFNPDGSFAGYIGSCIDVTEQRLAQDALSSIGRKLIKAQEQERGRIARELHDDINQRLAILQIDLSHLQERPVQSAPDLRSRLENLRLRLSKLSSDVQAMSHRLHSSKLEYLGLVVACKSFCKEVAERQNVDIDFQANGLPRTLPEDISLAVFRVLQESLQNAIKHSGSRTFDVHLADVSGELLLRIRDEGVGFDVNAAMDAHGLGLISMRERVALVKGTISITSKPGSGTQIEVRVPMAHEQSKELASGAA